MAKWCFMVILIVVAQTATARDIPNKTNKGVIGLTDQKNVVTFGGLGGVAGFGNDNQPIGGGGGGVGVGVGVGGGLGLGLGSTNGIGGVGAAGGVGTFGGLANGVGGLPALGGSGLGGGGPGAGDDGDAVPLP